MTSWRRVREARVDPRLCGSGELAHSHSRARLRQAGHLGQTWVLAAGHWGWDRRPEVAPAPHIFNSAVSFATAFIPFVLLYVAATTFVWRQ